MLEKSCKKFMLFREANELQQWIHEKENTLTNEEVGSDLEQVEVLQKKFDDFQKVNSVLGSSEVPARWHHGSILVPVEVVHELNLFTHRMLSRSSQSSPVDQHLKV